MIVFISSKSFIISILFVQMKFDPLLER